MSLVRTLAFCSLPLLAVAGCSSRPAAEAVSEATPSAGAAAPVGTAAAAVESIKPLKSGTSSAAAAPETLTGVVAETMDAASYTYVRLKTTDRGEVWAATSKFPVAVGDRVVVAVDMPMENFHSQTLNRDFPVIYFASAITKEDGGATAARAPVLAPGQTMPPGHPPVGTPRAAIESPSERMAPPQGGLAIADVWAGRQGLSGKAVTVRGKVMKFNGGIMGRNWVHLQDGSGSAAEGTNDITVTTDAVVKVGDVVTLRGTLALDKDFTAGYKYQVILENGALVK